MIELSECLTGFVLLRTIMGTKTSAVISFKLRKVTFLDTVSFID